MAETFGKRQRGQRKKERQLNKKERKKERAAGNVPEITEQDIVRDLFDGVDPNARSVVPDDTEKEDPAKP